MINHLFNIRLQKKYNSKFYHLTLTQGDEPFFTNKIGFFSKIFILYIEKGSSLFLAAEKYNIESSFNIISAQYKPLGLNLFNFFE